MGSFSLTCSLSGKVISSDDETVALLLTERKGYSSLGIYSWDYFSPIPIFIEGTYDSYGGLKNTKIFDSLESTNKKEQQKAEKILLNYCKENLLQDKKAIERLDDIVGRKTEIIKKNSKSTLLKIYFNALEEKDMPSEMHKEIEKMIIDLGFENKEEAQNFYIENKDILETKQVKFMFFDKQVLTKFLNSYGNEFKEEENEEIYAQSIQKARLGFEFQPSIVDFVSGGSYAGANFPAFSFKQIIKNSKDKSKGDLSKYHNQHGIDLALIHDFFTLLGKAWAPSVTVNEFVEHHGHNKAKEMQQQMLEDNFGMKIDDINQAKKVKIIKNL